MAVGRYVASFLGPFAAYAVGWWGVGQSGVAGAVLPFLFLFAYYGVFWGGWLAIPVLGVGATLLNPALPDPWRGRVRVAFGAWLLAWFGVLLALVWLGAPAGFRAVPV